MFDTDGPSAKTISALERYLQPGEKLLVAERIRREMTSAEWIGLLCGAPVLGLIGAAAGSLIGRSIVEQRDVGSLAHHSRCDDGFILITDRSLRLVKRGFLGSVDGQLAEMPISWLGSLGVAENKKIHLQFSDGSVRGFKLTNKRVLPYLQSLRPWIESTHRAAIQPMPNGPAGTAAGFGASQPAMAEAW